MNIYEKITRETRSKVSKLTLAQQEELLQLYENSNRNLTRKANSIQGNTLSKRWVNDYHKQLIVEQEKLRLEIKQQINDSTKKAAKIASEAQEKLLESMLDKGGLKTTPTFSNMFSQVSDNVVKDIINGGLYKDSKGLSKRIWAHSQEGSRDIQYIINQAILEKKSAKDLANDLKQFAKPPNKRGKEWAGNYAAIKNKEAAYNSIRLARTSINHAYQNATIQSSSLNPFVEGIEWQSAMQHGRTCQLCMDRDGVIYDIDKVPL